MPSHKDVGYCTAVHALDGDGGTECVEYRGCCARSRITGSAIRRRAEFTALALLRIRKSDT